MVWGPINSFENSLGCTLQDQNLRPKHIYIHKTERFL